jgi:ribosome biogenesis GTPase
MPGLEIRVGELSLSRQKGTHTTTTAQLFHFPGGGQLIDSPGIREFGLWPIPPNELLWSFKECRPYLGMCRFRDCKHQQEPGCAIQQALAEGAISQKRFESYYHILNSFADS